MCVSAWQDGEAACLRSNGIHVRTWGRIGGSAVVPQSPAPPAAQRIHDRAGGVPSIDDGLMTRSARLTGCRNNRSGSLLSGAASDSTAGAEGGDAFSGQWIPNPCPGTRLPWCSVSLGLMTSCATDLEQ